MPTAAGAAPAASRAAAWTGALFFFASLAYFLFSYLTVFGRPTHGPRASAIAIDVLLFTVFALHHSIFARERVRAAVARLVPPQLERSFYVWVASALFVAVVAWWQPVPGVAWAASGPARWVLVAAQGGGVCLTLWSAAALDILELSGVRQLSPRPGAPVFKTSGPYGWVRHPIYTGWFLMLFCAPAMTMTRLVFAIVSSAYLLIAIPFEERSLLMTAGDAYRRYARQVRWRLVPGLY